MIVKVILSVDTKDGPGEESFEINFGTGTTVYQINERILNEVKLWCLGKGFTLERIRGYRIKGPKGFSSYLHPVYPTDQTFNSISPSP